MEEKNPFPSQESNPGRPVRSPVVITTEISRIYTEIEIVGLTRKLLVSYTYSVFIYWAFHQRSLENHSSEELQVMQTNSLGMSN
jgi:hypothetical protein